MNKKGFIATSLIYSFFLIFITLFLTIIADYLQNKVLLNTIEKGIKEDLNFGLTCNDFDVNDEIFFQGDNFGNIFSENVDTKGSVPYYVCNKNCTDKKISISTTKGTPCNNEIDIDLSSIISLTKEPSDSEYYTITGVKNNE